jgi:hypothetical protein
MKAIDVNTSIIDGYIKLLDNLGPKSKLDLISGLTDSIKSDIGDKRNTFKRAFGAYSSKKDAEQIISEIRNTSGRLEY